MNQQEEFIPVTDTKNSEASGISHEKLHGALLHVEEMLGRSSMPFVLLDDAAAQIRVELPKLHMKKIVVGVMQRHATISGMQMFHTVIPKLEAKGNNWYYEHQGVPIVIRIIKRHYDFFDRPDVRFYYTGEFRIANPFEKYWKMRMFVA